MRLERFHIYTRILLAAALGVLLYGCEFSRTINPDAPPVRIDTSSQVGGTTVTLTLSPLTVSLRPGDTARFQATITGTANDSVLWRVSNGPGAITADGLYTAPATITGDSIAAAITATSVADSEQSSTATITIRKSDTVVHVDTTGHGGGGGCDTVNVTFSGTIKPILQNNCVGCHSGPGAPNGVNLTTYNGAKAVALNGKLSGVVRHAPGFPAMPKGGAKLSDCKVAQIVAWINRGAPNN
jgi:hypothetical protein